MSEAGALLQAVLSEFTLTDQELLLHLEAALELEVDPLDYCAHRFGLGETQVMQRAAEWAGLEFFARIPQIDNTSPVAEKIERFGEIRALSLPLLDRRVVYAAPRFETMLRLKLLHELRPDLRQHIAIVPGSAIRSELAQLAEAAMMDRARHRLLYRWPHAVGHLDAPIAARTGFAALLALVLLVVSIAPWLHRPLFVPLVGLLLVIPALLRLMAALSPRQDSPDVALLEDADLPVYTVLVPLRDEAQMVPQLANALRAIDYPPEKLDVHFVVEMQSHATVAAVQEELHDPRFELLLVPDALPRTKPKALNYALPMVRGEHLVVYDAEDIPDPGQLRLAASTFALHPELDCLQAELVIDNAGESWLAAWFAGEYAGQFGLMLPLLARLHLPMPLGGTSNHFRVSSLREVGGWDPFNVTEDADLGIRLARLGVAREIIWQSASLHLAASPLILSAVLKLPCDSRKRPRRTSRGQASAWSRAAMSTPHLLPGSSNPRKGSPLTHRHSKTYVVVAWRGGNLLSDEPALRMRFDTVEEALTALKAHHESRLYRSGMVMEWNKQSGNWALVAQFS
ncbi:MAG: glycosyltransferase [Devosia sp.]